MIVNINSRISPKLSINGFFNYINANSDGAGGSNPSNSWDLSQDYGRAGFIRPRQVTVIANYTGPWGITFNPFLVAQSGGPYNITTANDLTGDNFFNGRPAYATSSSPASDMAQTNFGALDALPQPGEALLPINLGTGPAAVTVNLRLSRSFGIGPSAESSAPQESSGGGRAGGHGGAGGGGGRGGVAGGGLGGIFGGGGNRGGMSGTGRKYSLNFNLQAQNGFNDINYANPSGVVVPTLDPATGLYGPGSCFGVSTSLAKGMGVSQSGSAARRIFAQVTFQF